MLWLEKYTAWPEPSTRLKRVRACSSATGLRFCGRMLEACTKPSASRYVPSDDQLSRCQVKRDMLSATELAFATAAACQSLADAASSVLSVGASKPSSCALRCRSSGWLLPARAAAPSGLVFRRP